jgi:hypothetical protein
MSDCEGKLLKFTYARRLEISAVAWESCTFCRSVKLVARLNQRSIKFYSCAASKKPIVAGLCLRL